MKLAFSLLLLLEIVALLGCGNPSSKSRYTVNDPKDPNTTWRTERPLTYAEAVSAGKCPIALPAGATNIQYVDFYAGYGGFAQFVRFEAAVEVCRDHARRLLQAHNANLTATNLMVAVQSRAFDKSLAESLARHAKVAVEEVARAAWFDVDAIAQGETWGEHRNHRPLILIDTVRGVLYYSKTD